MVCRTLMIKVISASDLANLQDMFQMKVYAEVSILGINHTKFCTPVDKVNKTNPVWNCTVKFRIDEDSLEREGVLLVVKLYSKGTFGDAYIGEVRTSIRRLLHKDEPGKWTAFRYLLEKSNEMEMSQGKLILAYKFQNESDDEDSSGDEIVNEETSIWESSFDGLADGLRRIVLTASPSTLDGLADGVKLIVQTISGILDVFD